MNEIVIDKGVDISTGLEDKVTEEGTIRTTSPLPFCFFIPPEENIWELIETSETVSKLSEEETTIWQIGVELNFDFPQINFAIDLYKSFKDLTMLTISKTGDDEILFYEKDESKFRNLLIDEDGNVEVLIIPSPNSKAKNKLFFSEDNFKLPDVIEAFHEL